MIPEGRTKFLDPGIDPEQIACFSNLPAASRAKIPIIQDQYREDAEQ